MNHSRRSFLGSWLASGPLLLIARGEQPPKSDAAIPATFPSHDPNLAREMVSVSHGNVPRVRELIANRPALAKAVWDWGYGDWETALGAAAHVGNREIAELLIRAGAPPTIFSAAMLGELAVVQAMIGASPGLQRTKGAHGISLLAHAKAGTATDVVRFLEALGDADPRYRNEPLSESDRTAIVGIYTYGSSATDRLAVQINKRGVLIIQREGASERNLFHLGERVFHPAGAEDVRIRFGAGAPAATVHIEDGALVVTGKRQQAVPFH